MVRAEHRLLKKSVAIKLWSLPNTHTSKANAALLREARAASATRHPGVVDVYDILRLPDGRIVSARTWGWRARSDARGVRATLRPPL